MSTEYTPPGLGKTLEDLISKHVGKGTRDESPLQWALRNAAKNREALAKIGNETPRKAKPVAVKEAPGRKKGGKGRTAYEWASANGKSAAEAAKHFGIVPNRVHVHRRQFGLPPLADFRIKSGKYLKARERREARRKLCEDAYATFMAKRLALYDAAKEHGLSAQSILRFCVERGLKRVHK